MRDVVRPLPRIPARSSTISPRVLISLSSATLLALLILPIVAVVVRAFPEGAFSRALDDPLVHQALVLSVVTTVITVAITIVLGTPVAYLLARYHFRGREIISTLVDLPMVLPPAVAGVALLMTFGRRGLFGPMLLDIFGVTIPFTTVAVILAQTFVAAPFFVSAAKAGFESVDPGLEDVSATLGISSFATFRSVTVPLALPALLGGAVMTWARALGEFGATIMFAGNFAGRTQTMPLAIYQTLESGKLDAALALALMLVVVSFTILFVFRSLARRAIGVTTGA